MTAGCRDRHRLAEAAGCGENLAFARMHELFLGGRLPLGSNGDRCAVFQPIGT
jgi:hypothetical protein